MRTRERQQTCVIGAAIGKFEVGGVIGCQIAQTVRPFDQTDGSLHGIGQSQFRGFIGTRQTVQISVPNFTGGSVVDLDQREGGRGDIFGDVLQGLDKRAGKRAFASANRAVQQYCIACAQGLADPRSQCSGGLRAMKKNAHVNSVLRFALGENHQTQTRVGFLAGLSGGGTCAGFGFTGQRDNLGFDAQGYQACTTGDGRDLHINLVTGFQDSFRRPHRAL